MAKRRASDQARDFFRALGRAERPAPVYLLYGEEPYLLERAVEAVVACAMPEGPNDLHYALYRAPEASADEVIAAAATLPFLGMGGGRVIVAREVQTWDARQIAQIAAYAEDPNPTSTLVLCAHTAKRSLDGRQAGVRRLKKAAEVGEFRAFWPEDAERFARKQAAERGVRLSDEAAARIVHALGTDLGAIEAAVEKIDLYLGPGEREAGAAEVGAVVSVARDFSVFELTGALGDKDLGRALFLLDEMLSAGEAPILIAQMIARHFRIVARLQDPSVRSAPRSEQARRVGVAPYFLKEYARHARAFGAAEVERILERLVDLDLALKSSRVAARHHIERLAIEVCAARREERRPGR